MNCCHGEEICRDAEFDSSIVYRDPSCGPGVVSALLDNTTYSDNQICYATSAYEMVAASYGEDLTSVEYGLNKMGIELGCWPFEDTGENDICYFLMSLMNDL